MIRDKKAILTDDESSILDTILVDNRNVQNLIKEALLETGIQVDKAGEVVQLLKQRRGELIDKGTLLRDIKIDGSDIGWGDAIDARLYYMRPQGEYFEEKLDGRCVFGRIRIGDSTDIPVFIPSHFKSKLLLHDIYSSPIEWVLNSLLQDRYSSIKFESSLPEEFR